MSKPANRGIWVAWSPAADNYSAVAYNIIATSSSGTVTSTQVSGTSGTVEKLVNGVEYTITVRATNAVGSSLTSPVGPISPFATPGAPELLTAVGLDSAASITWAGADPMGAEITGYAVTVMNGEQLVAEDVVSSDARSHTIPTLFNGLRYKIEVRRDLRRRRHRTTLGHRNRLAR